MAMRYKAVIPLGSNRFASLYDDTTYELGKTLVQPAKPSHGGGYYVSKTIEAALDRGRRAQQTLSDVGRLVILECRVNGDCVEYSSSKEAWSEITPRRVVLEELPVTALMCERSQHSRGRSASSFGGPDTYVAVQIVPFGVEPLHLLNAKVAKARGIRIIYCGDGYRRNQATNRSMLGQAWILGRKVKQAVEQTNPPRIVRVESV